MRGTEMTDIEKKLGYRFKNPNLLKLALTHKSATHDDKSCYERLEFLGDAVLELVVSKYLFEHFPQLSEGELTNLRATIVCSETLSKVAETLNLKRYIVFGKNEKRKVLRVTNQFGQMYLRQYLVVFFWNQDLIWLKNSHKSFRTVY